MTEKHLREMLQDIEYRERHKDEFEASQRLRQRLLERNVKIARERRLLKFCLEAIKRTVLRTDRTDYRKVVLIGKLIEAYEKELDRRGMEKGGKGE